MKIMKNCDTFSKFTLSFQDERANINTTRGKSRFIVTLNCALVNTPFVISNR